MKTISIPAFEALVARDDWHRDQELEVVEHTVRHVERYDEHSDDVDRLAIPCAWGWACRVSTLAGVTITYDEGFNYDEYDSASLSPGTEGQDEVWAIDGVRVLDDDGDEMSADELADYLPDAFSSIDYSVLQIDQVTDIDTDEDSDMETITLEIDNQPDIRFTGELIASAASSCERALGYWSGQTGRWTELALYRTQGGKYICHQVGRTQWEGERDRHSGAVCESLDEVREFFGHRWLAKHLYAEAGIDDAIDVT